MTRKDSFVAGEYYHCYNRGVDKRDVFLDRDDFSYFLTALDLFNCKDSLGGMMEYRYPKNVNSRKAKADDMLVNIIAYCLNPNHYHLLLQPNSDGGVQKFMQKINTGYTMYFNKKHVRSGALFQGRYKSSYVGDNEYFRHVLTYINLNNLVHSGIGKGMYRSSLQEYGAGSICDYQIIEELFGTLQKFESFARSRLPLIKEQKRKLQELKNSENIYLE